CRGRLPMTLHEPDDLVQRDLLPGTARSRLTGARGLQRLEEDALRLRQRSQPRRVVGCRSLPSLGLERGMRTLVDYARSLPPVTRDLPERVCRDASGFVGLLCTLLRIHSQTDTP